MLLHVSVAFEVNAFLKGGLVAFHSANEFLLVLLLLRCLFFPAWCSLWLTAPTKVTDPTEAETSGIGLRASLLAIYVIPTHSWHTNNTDVNTSVHSPNGAEKRPSAISIQRLTLPTPSPPITDFCAFLPSQTTSSDYLCKKSLSLDLIAHCLNSSK